MDSDNSGNLLDAISGPLPYLGFLFNCPAASTSRPPFMASENSDNSIDYILGPRVDLQYLRNCPLYLDSPPPLFGGFWWLLVAFGGFWFIAPPVILGLGSGPVHYLRNKPTGSLILRRRPVIPALGHIYRYIYGLGCWGWFPSGRLEPL